MRYEDLLKDVAENKANIESAKGFTKRKKDNNLVILNHDKYNEIVDAHNKQVNRLIDINYRLMKKVQEYLKEKSPIISGGKEEGTYKQYFKCPECGKIMNYEWFSFCPHCGVKLNWDK